MQPFGEGRYLVIEAGAVNEVMTSHSAADCSAREPYHSKASEIGRLDIDSPTLSNDTVQQSFAAENEVESRSLTATAERRSIDAERKVENRASHLIS